MEETLDTRTKQLLNKDKQYLDTTSIPIITISAAFKEDLRGFHGLDHDETIPDIVFSRAHFSMAAGVAIQAWGEKINPKKAWVVDPTNFVSRKNWKNIRLTEYVGKTLARQPLLKSLKDIIDRFSRKNLPILTSITPPLLYLTRDIHRPILSLHIAAGNILAAQGKTVVQVITDPHVREDYLYQAHKDNISFCVFDDRTKTDFLEKAKISGIEVDPQRVVVTGPPVDPRIIACRQHKTPWHTGDLNMCLTTGGLGTNKDEMERILHQVISHLRPQHPGCKLLVYVGTHRDIRDMVKKIASDAKVKIGQLNDRSARLRLLYHPQIVDANELLIKHAFPWADGFITKPSGDMAYDAVASGSFLLTLKEWGPWEDNIRQVFEQLNISRPAQVDHIVEQIQTLRTPEDKHTPSWMESAMKNAQDIDPLFITGAKNIISHVRSLTPKT